MNLAEFSASALSGAEPPNTLRVELQSLWLDKAGDWRGAHDLVDQLPGRDAAWVHAYLHRVEGDDWNAEYWYNRAGQSMPTSRTLDEEWESIAVHFLERCEE